MDGTANTVHDRDSGLRIGCTRIYGLEACVASCDLPVACSYMPFPRESALDRMERGNVTEDAVGRWRRAERLASRDAGFLAGIAVHADVTAPMYLVPELGRWFTELSGMRLRNVALRKAAEWLRWPEAASQGMSPLVPGTAVEAWLGEVRRTMEDPGLDDEARRMRIVACAPSGLLTTSRMATDYLRLRRLWRASRGSSRSEWRCVRRWVSGLPMAAELVTGGGDE